MNPLIKMAFDKVLTDPDILASAGKAMVESFQAGAKERQELREMNLRTQAELLKLRSEFEEYRRSHP